MKADFVDGYAVGYQMAVGECFRDALARERFSAGDTIYDTRLAYIGTWAEALVHIEYCFQVVAAHFDHVEYDILVPGPDRTKLVVAERIKEPVSCFIEKLRNGNNKCYKTDAGNGSYGICRVIDASRSPSPDPNR
jgi:hypothetical protein